MMSLSSDTEQESWMWDVEGEGEKRRDGVVVSQRTEKRFAFNAHQTSFPSFIHSMSWETNLLCTSSKRRTPTQSSHPADDPASTNMVMRQTRRKIRCKPSLSSSKHEARFANQLKSDDALVSQWERALFSLSRRSEGKQISDSATRV